MGSNQSRDDPTLRGSQTRAGGSSRFRARRPRQALTFAGSHVAPVHVPQSIMCYPKIRNEMCDYHPPWMVRSGSEFIDISTAPDCWSPADVGNYLESWYIIDGYQTDPPDVPEAPDPAPFNYSPLSKPDETRILQLLPGTASDPLRVQLQHISLDSDVEYVAISYAWGSKSEVRTIMCNGSSIKIPANLFTALRRIRHSSQPCAVWADAACINQNDDIEKGHQVRLMRRIFQKAQKVTIWLGTDLNGIAKSIFALLTQIYQKEFSKVPPPKDKIWSWVANMFSTQWFSRLWCVQEVALASAAEVLWDTEKIPWEHVAFAAAWIRSVPAPALRDNKMVGVYNACLMHSLSNESERQTPVSFLQLLTLSRQFLTSDSRDKVYGLLGIPTLDANPDQGVYFLEPDYTKTLSQVYLDCAKKIIQSSASLRVLSYVQLDTWRVTLSVPATVADTELDQNHQLVTMPFSASNNYGYPKKLNFIDGLPSWVPRWHQYFARTLAPPELALKTFFADKHIHQMRPLIQDLTLVAHGVEFSAVAEVSWRRMKFQSPGDGFRDEYGYDVWRNYFPAAMSNPLGIEPLEIMCLTLTAGKDWFGTLVEDVKQHIADFIAYLDNKCPFGHPEEGPNVEQYVFNPQDKVSPEVLGNADHFMEAMAAACSERKVFLTENGYLGLGPKAMEEGDIICVLSGAMVPIVLRPCDDDKYMVVGESYVHGIMFGENIQIGQHGEGQKMFYII